MLLKDLPIQQGFLGEWHCVGVFHAGCCEGFIGILPFGIFLEVVYHRMAYCIGESSLFAPQNLIRKVTKAFKGMTEQIFTLSVFVQLHFRIKRHDVFHKIKITEGDSCFQRVDRDAAVSAKHIIHMQLADTLLRLLLKRLGRRRKIRIFVAEQLVGYFAGEKNPDIGLLMDCLADQVHAHACADGRYVKGAEDLNESVQGGNDLIGRHVDLRMVAADIVGNLLCVFQVDGVLAHTNGESFDRGSRLSGRNGAHQGRVQAAREQESHLCICHKPFFHTGNQFFPDMRTGCFQIITAKRINLCNIAIADHFTVLPVMTGRKRHDPVRKTDQVLRLAGKEDHTLAIIAVIQRADANGIPRSDICAAFSVIDDAGELCIQHGEHIRSIFAV